MVPEGWHRSEIGEVCAAIVDCVNKTAPVVDCPTPFKMIRTTNVRNGRVDTNNVRYVTEETFKTWTRRGQLLDDDIILTREAPVGEVGLLTDAEGCFLGQRTMVYRADPALMDQAFLYQTMISEPLVRQYHADSAGGTVAHIRVPDCSKFLVGVPPLPEQRKIAEILSTWDLAIETTEALLANARTQKRALMQSLLTGKRRFPEFEGQAWREVRLGDVCQLQTGPFGSQLKANEYECTSEGVAVVMPKALINGAVAFSSCDYISPDRSEALAKHFLLPGDILFSRRGDVARTALIEDNDHPSMCGTGCLRARPRTRLLGRFLAKVLQSEFCRNWLEENAVGQTMLNLNTKIIAGLPVRIPGEKEQQRIVSLMEIVDEEIRSFAVQIKNLRTEKKALMQQLLTGKRRVKV